MRLVQWSAQERADQPDLTAMSFLVLGEFKRTARTLLVGSESTYVGRGFAVEPAGAPDATVTVKLDPGGGAPLGFVVGAENPGTVQYGHIFGDEDDDGNLEGNTQQVLDFTGQPPATYTVQVSFSYADGASDNRAFWNEGTDTEFVQATDTRHLPTWQARFSGAPSGEWVDLADVVWDGVSIDSADITDLRDFLFEGRFPFDNDSQPLVTVPGGLPDFGRTTNRSASAVTVAGLVEAVRALQRQVQDLKGQDSTGKFNWYGRVPGPLDPTFLLPATQTKTLRSIDHITYTVGDGASEWGDFNGVDGLDDCLAHVEAAAASLPPKVTVVLKSRQTSFVWDLGGAAGNTRTIAAIDLTIRGEVGSSNPGAMARVDVDNFSASDVALTIANSPGALRLENIRFEGAATSSTATPDITVLLISSAEFQAEHCFFGGHRADAATGFAIDCNTAIGLRMRDCSGLGRIRITGGSVSARSGLVEGCDFDDASWELRNASSGARAQNLTFRDCSFADKVYTDASAPDSVLCLEGCSHVRVYGCRFQSDTNDLVRLGFVPTYSVASKDIYFRDCFFQSGADSGTHSPNAGKNGADGTGWGIYAKGVDATDEMQDVVVDGCRFEGPVTGMVDAGGIYVDEGRRFRIVNCTFRQFKAGSIAVESCKIVTLESDTNVPNAHVVANCFFGDWRTGASTRNERGLALNGVLDTKVHDCVFDSRADDGTDIVRPSLYGALRVAGLSCHRTQIHHCSFLRWNQGTLNESSILVEAASRQLVVHGCTFEECGGAPIDCAALATYSVFSSNVFRNSSVAGVAADNHGIEANGVSNAFIANTFDFDGLRRCIWTGTTTSCTVIGNTGENATIDRNVSPAAATGISEPPGVSLNQIDLNNVSAYNEV